MEHLPDTGEPLTPDELDTTDEPVPDDEFMDADHARRDQTIDDTEAEQAPHQDLPEGARAQDYEHEDGAEETPPAHPGQARG